nr:GGDEF domain-containing protein [Vibrio sp. S17_S38]
MAKKFDFKVNYIKYDTYSDAIHALETNKVDFSTNITYSPERAKTLDVSSPTNIEYTYFYSANRASKYIGIEDIKRVAVAKDIIFKSNIKELYPNIETIEFNNTDQAKKMISSGDVDGVIDTITSLKTFINAGFSATILNDKFPIKPVGLATQKGRNSELMKKMVNYIHSAKMQRTLRTAIENYQFQIRQQALRLSMLASGIDPAIPLKIKLEDLLQFSAYDKNGKPHGIFADMLKQACHILMLKCEIVSKADDSWSEMYADLVNKKIDILGPVTISPERNKDMYFSPRYFSTKAIMVKRSGYRDATYKNVSEMIIERISVIKGDYYDQLLTKMLPQKGLVKLNSREEQIQSLLDGKTDYAVLNQLNYNKMIQDNDSLLPIVEDKLIGNFHQSSLGFGFAKTEQGQVLADLFTSAINLIDTASIINKYDSQIDWREIIKKEKRLTQIIIWILILSSLLMASVIWYVYRQSIIDNLTKLKNRRALYQKYSRGIPTTKTVVYLDINNFKIINDTYGHQMGDEVLKLLARQISTYWLGQSFRLGGDEFVLIGSAKGKQLELLLAPIRSFHFIDDGHNLMINTSAGISLDREKTIKVDDVLNAADIEMYKTKKHRLAER